MRPLELRWIPSMCAESWRPFEVVRSRSNVISSPGATKTCHHHPSISTVYALNALFLFRGHVSEAAKCLLTGKVSSGL